MRRSLLLLPLLSAACSAAPSLPSGGEGPPAGGLLRTQTAGDIFDPHVFNWRFYLNSYGDLLGAGLRSEAQARQHWRIFGLAEGRQAAPQFHTRQYLDRYADLRAAFGADFRAALLHYLSFGLGEGRRGIVVGPAYGRVTAANDILSVSASARTAYAVDSVLWNGRELVNSFDHGRQVQLALSINGWGECYNPTEAGGGYDGLSHGTTSEVLGVRGTDSTLSTESRAAFWMRPGEPHPSPTPGCSVARNAELVSGYTFSKEVQVGVLGVRHAVQLQLSVLVPEAVDGLTLEGPTGYLGGELTAYFTEDLSSGALTRIAHDPMGEQGLPLVFATEDGAYAMGAWTPDLPQPGNPGGYGKFAFPSGDPSAATNKWNIVFRYGALAAGTRLSQRSYLFVGSLENVRVAMKQIHDAWRDGRL